MRYFSVIILVMFIAAIASAQVDTLQLIEIGSIQAPSEITELYVEDLDGDSLKEIIICTDYYVYIYNSQTYQVEWTSPPLSMPTDLLFEDINRDDLMDFSLKDSSNIYLFDPHTPQIIWTSPMLDSTYKCYTIGDRNGDNEIDIVIIDKEIFWRWEYVPNFDTVWIQIYDGNEYNNPDTIIHLLQNECDDIAGCYRQLSNIPTSTCVSQFGLYGNEEIHIVVSTFIEHDFVCPPFPSWPLNELNDYGSIILYNADNMSYDTTFTIGYFDEVTVEQINNDKYLYVITKESIFRPDSSTGYVNDYLIGNDFIYSINIIWEGPGNFEQYSGAVQDNFIDNDYLNEVCYGGYETLILRNIDGSETYWTINSLLGLNKVISSYKCDSLYANIMVICRFGETDSEYRFYDSENGSLTALINQFNGEILKVNDLYNDGNDEILSIDEDILYIFYLDYATGVGEDSRLPYRAFLRSNYPNPFNSATTIEYDLPKTGHVRIDIYDLLGRKVETLVDEEKQAGRHRVMWDASAYSSGIYFYRIEARDFVDTRRMVYLK